MRKEAAPPSARRLSYAIGVVAILLLACAGPAWGARPAKGTHFYGFEGETFGKGAFKTFSDVGADLRISRSGRAFGRSELEVFGCVHFKVRLRGVGIRSDGTFSLRSGRLRLRGRFLTSEYGRIVYRTQMPRRGRHPGRVCRKDTVALYLNGEPPFSGCGTQRAKTLVRTPSGRIFKQYRLTQQGFVPHVFACLFETDRRVLLGQDYDDSSIDLPRLAGPFVAYVDVGCGLTECGGDVKLIDLRTATRRSPERTTSFDGNPGVSDLELKDNGSAAWIADTTRFPDGQIGVPELRVLDGRGLRTIDSGLAIEAGSLTLSGSTLTWRNGGVVRSATID